MSVKRWPKATNQFTLPPTIQLQIGAGGTHSLALTASGRIFIWGRASYGRLGLGDGARDHYSPVELPLPGGHDRWRVAAITAGGRHSMCLAVPVRDSQGAVDAVTAALLAAEAAGRGGGGNDGNALTLAVRSGGGGGGGGFQPPPAVSVARTGSLGIPLPVSPLRRPLSAASGDAGSGSGAPAAPAAPLSRAGSHGLPATQATVPPRQTATAAQVRALSPPPRPSRNAMESLEALSFSNMGGAGGSASGSGAAAATSPRSLAAVLPLGLSGALSEVPQMDALPVSGEEEESEEAHVQADLDRRHGMASAGSSSDALAAAAAVDLSLRPGGGDGGREGREGRRRVEEEEEDDDDEAGEEEEAAVRRGRAREEAAHDPRGFLRIDSVPSVSDSFTGIQDEGSPVAPGPGGAYTSSERTSIHNLTHLS
jgi:hypothetical protein